MITNSVEETRAAGAELAFLLKVGEVIALNGSLGCGKTEFVRGLVAALDPTVVVRSPSFSLVNSYETPTLTIHHFDFYRLNHVDELHEIGFEEYCADPHGVCLVEWAGMFAELNGRFDRILNFSDGGEGRRIIEEVSHSEGY